MSQGNFVQIIGTIGGEPELRFTQGGHAVCSFSVAWSPRRKNKTTDQWEDGDTTWFRCTAWRDLGENIAASITKGSRVVVTGSVTARDWEDKDGNKRTSVEIDVEDCAPSLRWAQAHVEKASRSSGGGGGGSRQPDPVYGQEEPFTRPATEHDI